MSVGKVINKNKAQSREALRSGTISGKSDAYGELLNYNLLENKLTFPIINGFQLRCRPTAILKIGNYSWPHQFDEYIYDITY